jgi:hypothetical protein
VPFDELADNLLQCNAVQGIAGMGGGRGHGGRLPALGVQSTAVRWTKIPCVGGELKESFFIEMITLLLLPVLFYRWLN